MMIPPMGMRVIERVRRPLLCIAAGAMVAASFEPANLHWLIWVAFVPLLLALHGQTPRHAAALAGLFGFTLFALTVHWLWNLFGSFSTSLFVISALFPALFGWLYARASLRFSPAALIWLVPTLWTATEFLRAECWVLRFGWGAVGYSQVANPTVLQSASVVGIYGITWLVVFVNALLFWTLMRPGDRGVRLAWLAGSLFAGGLKVHEETSRRRPARAVAGELLAACVQGEEVSPDVYAAAASQLGRTDLMVLPEYALGGDPSTDIDGPAFAALARKHHTYLVYGCKRNLDERGDRAHNIALVLGRDGRELGEYAKRNPVPFFSDGVAGKRSVPVATGIGRIGLAVCFDADFERPCRQAVANGAQVLAVPTFDAMWWGRTMHLQHEAMPRMRAVEMGRWVVRSASSGYSMIVNPRGVVVARARTQKPEAISAPIEMRNVITPYVRWGWLLPWVCVLVSVLGSVVRPRREPE